MKIRSYDANINIYPLINFQMNNEYLCTNKPHFFPYIYSDKWALSQPNNENRTILMFACMNQMEDVCLKFLQYPTKCSLDTVDVYGFTALTYSCYYGLDQVALKILEFPYLCALNVEHTNNKTALTYALMHGMKSVCNRINEINNDIIYILLNQAWYITCQKEQEYTEKIKLINKNELSTINNEGRTVLMVACSNILPTMCLEILKYPNECSIYQINDDGNTALILTALCNDISMKPVMLKILEYSDSQAIYHTNNVGKTFITYLEYSTSDFSDILEFVLIKLGKTNKRKSHNLLQSYTELDKKFKRV